MLTGAAKEDDEEGRLMVRPPVDPPTPAADEGLLSGLAPAPLPAKLNAGAAVVAAGLSSGLAPAPLPAKLNAGAAVVAAGLSSALEGKLNAGAAGLSSGLAPAPPPAKLNAGAAVVAAGLSSALGAPTPPKLNAGAVGLSLGLAPAPPPAKLNAGAAVVAAGLLSETLLRFCAIQVSATLPRFDAVFDTVKEPDGLPPPKLGVVLVAGVENTDGPPRVKLPGLLSLFPPKFPGDKYLWINEYKYVNTFVWSCGVLIYIHSYQQRR